MSSTGAIPKGGVRPKTKLGLISEPSPVAKNDNEVCGEPLDKKFIPLDTKGLEKSVPALHKGWVEKGTYIKYDPPPLPDEDGILPPGARESWLEQMEFYEQDIQNLLNLPHHKFWSHVVYDPAIHKSLETYLTNGPRWYDNDALDDYSRPIVESLHKQVFLIYARMATFKESKTCHITPSVFGEIIYDNFIFDVCKLLDICVLYGPTNSQFISKMISNIFTNQPKYYDDLKQIMSSIEVALANIEEKLNVAESFVPLTLETADDSLSLADLHDLSLYLLDTFYSLQMLISLHPAAATFFHSASFEFRLSAFYERVIPPLMESLNEWCEDPLHSIWAKKLTQRVKIARSSIIATFRAIVTHKCFTPLGTSDQSSSSSIDDCIETYLQVMSTCIEDRVFICDYCTMHPMSKDATFFQEHQGDITSLTFISEAIQDTMLELGASNDVEDLTLDDKTKDSVDVSGMNGYAENGTAVPNDIEMVSLVSGVQDLLPDLGAGFIQECLKYYGYSSEEVINALLEDNLPPSLVCLDRDLPAIEQPPPPPPPEEVLVEETKTVRQVDYMDRANIYDNDDFDVFKRKDVDMEKIHKGKKSKKQNTDQGTIEKVKEIAKMYDERGGRSIYENELLEEEEDDYAAWNYEDEYDDTYDDNDTRNIDDFDIDKIKRRPGLIGAGALNKQFNYADEDDDVEGEETSQTRIPPLFPVADNSKQRFPGGARPKNRGNTRGVQRVYSNSRSSKPSQPMEKTPSPELEEEENEEEGPPKPNLNFMPFCENPEDVRKRREQYFASKGYRGRGGSRGGGRGGGGGGGGGSGGRQQENRSNTEAERRPKISHSSNKNSGKGWRNSENADDENKRYGGKYKEDTNHGKAQSKEYRHKMMHKNEHKRQGAQAKFNRNN